ncbi:hypothetical protein GCM10008096_16360 [Zhihengliuella salsuginis]|uniref:Uncharacterized protein n=1 Tax=Zhihengliuella salsuginis TaxID=578222 RepID=A0ABQ3GJJ5_9MICC|nr:hypothetical protein GCM10008096_16360 [Zhihengliuella salsuginis]
MEQRVDFGVCCAEHLSDSGGERRLARAGNARDDDAPRPQREGIIGAQHLPDATRPALREGSYS